MFETYETLRSLDREKCTEEKITSIESFIEKFAEPVENLLLMPLKVLPKQTDISKAEANLEDMKNSWNIEIRLKSFLHNLSVLDLKASESEKTKLSAKSCSNVLSKVKSHKIILPTFNGNMYECLAFKDIFR